MFQGQVNRNGFFTLKDEVWLENQRYAGIVLAKALSLAKSEVKENIATAHLDNICEEYILSKGCKPTFKGYTGFPATTCISINEEIVHGIPSEDVVLKRGDIVKIDCGATYKGAIADSAISVVVDDYIDYKHKELLEGCYECLCGVIDLIGNNVGSIRLGDVGFFIKKEANKIGAKTIIELTGHGLEIDTPHWHPQVFNDGNKGDGIILLPNMTICIEPIFIFGSDKTYVKRDKYTIAGESVGVHWEHTIFLHANRAEIITKREDE